MSTTPASGAISVSQLASVSGVSQAGYSLTGREARILAKKGTNPISLSDFYSKNTPLKKTLNPNGLAASLNYGAPASLGWNYFHVEIKSTGEFLVWREGVPGPHSDALVSLWGTYDATTPSDLYVVTITETVAPSGLSYIIYRNGTPVFSYPQALDGNVTITLHRGSGSNSMSFPITITELYSGLTFSTTLNLSFAG